MTPRLSPRELDRCVVPVAAARLRRSLASASRTRAQVLGSAVRGLRRASVAGRRLDERVTAAGPLRRVHDAPRLAASAVAVVLLAGAASALLLDEPGPSVPAVAPAPRVVDLGVPPGTDAQEHLRQAQQDLDELAVRLPRTELLAVVHFDRYLAAEEVTPLLAGTQVERVYLRASAAGPEAEVLAVPAADGSVATVLPALCEATSARKAEQVITFTELAAAVPPDVPEQQETRARFEQEAARAAAEAAAYGGACTTAFSAVVRAPVDVLSGLGGRDGVRGVEAAPTGTALDELDVDPLLPEASGGQPAGES